MKILKCVSISVFLLLLVPTLALALSIEEAKEKGLVGEQPNGYLGTVSGSSEKEVSALVESVNIQRKAKYQEIAASNGTALSAVEALAAKKAIELTKPGHYVKLSSGEWKKK